ncbi:MAG: hypothetical protein ACI9ES_000682 [Oceanospirillaceae bacterium]|jgi:hypothetical protein
MSVKIRDMHFVKFTAVFLFLHSVCGITATEADESLTLALSGVIEDKCEITIPTNSSFDFSQQLAHTANIAIDCNQTMIVALRSENGGLKLSNTVGESAVVAAYDLELKIESIQFRMTANSVEIEQEKRFSAGEDIPFTTSASLNISLPEELVFAGQYNDVLHIEVYPNITMQGI